MTTLFDPSVAPARRLMKAWRPGFSGLSEMGRQLFIQLMEPRQIIFEDRLSTQVIDEVAAFVLEAPGCTMKTARLARIRKRVERREFAERRGQRLREAIGAWPRGRSITAAQLAAAAKVLPSRAEEFLEEEVRQHRFAARRMTYAGPVAYIASNGTPQVFDQPPPQQPPLFSMPHHVETIHGGSVKPDAK